MSTASEAASVSSRRGWLPFPCCHCHCGWGNIVSVAARIETFTVSAQTALVRFTGIDWDTQARIEALAHRDRDTT